MKILLLFSGILAALVPPLLAALVPPLLAALVPPLLAALVPPLLAAAPPAPVWDLVGQAGPVKTVYVEPAVVKDTKVLSKIVEQMITRFGKERPIQIDFFDDRDQTPVTRPYTTGQKRHHRAKFNLNPKTGLRRFVWVSYAAEDPNRPDLLKLSEREETLPSP